jgi:drug/metabolite transporter (DMT)-like permease
MKALSEKSRGVIALVFLSFIFASMGVFARYLDVAEFTLFQQTYLRILGAFVLSLALFSKAIDYSKLRSLSGKQWFLIVFRAVTLYGGILLISEAFFHAKYGNVAFAASLPLLPLFGYIFFKERFTTAKAFYTILAIIGLTLVAIKDPSSIFSWGKGELLALSAIILFDFSYIARKWQGDVLSNKEITTLMFFVGGLILLSTSLFVLGEPLPSANLFSLPIIAVLFCAIAFNVLNLYLTNYGFERVEVILAGNILTLEVVFSLLIGIFLYREAFILRELLGGALIVFSVYRMNKIS